MRHFKVSVVTHPVHMQCREPKERAAPRLSSSGERERGREREGEREREKEREREREDRCVAGCPWEFVLISFVGEPDKLYVMLSEL